MKHCLFLAILLSNLFAYCQPPQAEIQRQSMLYQGQQVEGRLLRVTSTLDLPIDSVWAWVQTPALLEYVAKGRIRFVPLTPPLPDRWQLGDTVAVKMRLYGFLPFGGVHYLLLDSVAADRYWLQTQEWDGAAKVWNHAIHLRALSDGRTQYTDEILIYGAGRTGLITQWAKSFYRHRQRRWQGLQARPW